MGVEDNNLFSMEMISGGTEVHEDGRIEPVYVVKFISNGQPFLYPWKHLKECVLNWIEVEKGMKW